MAKHQIVTDKSQLFQVKTQPQPFIKCSIIRRLTDNKLFFSSLSMPVQMSSPSQTPAEPPQEQNGESSNDLLNLDKNEEYVDMQEIFY